MPSVKVWTVALERSWICSVVILEASERSISSEAPGAAAPIPTLPFANIVNSSTVLFLTLSIVPLATVP